MYTLVRHSGSATGHHEFYKAVEEVSFEGRRIENAIKKRGGLVFSDYKEARDRAEKENYQPGNEGIIPKVPGTFSNFKVEGLALYVPPKEK